MFNTVGVSDQRADISSVHGGDVFQQGTWMFGYSKSMRYVGFTPNLAAAIRIVCQGSLLVHAFSMESIYQHLSTTKGVEDSFITVDNIIALIRGLTASSLAEAVKGGLVARSVVVEPKQLLYVPQSWVVVEACSDKAGSLLHYGVRKSFFTKTEAGTKGYQLCVDVYKNSKFQTTRMEDIVTKLESLHTADAPAVS